jgi:hypothetical protein
MKKTAIIIFITAFIFSTVSAGNIHAADKHALTPDYLALNIWGPLGGSGVSIKFNKNGQFDMTDDNTEQNCEEYLQGSGKYIIKENKVILTFDHFPPFDGYPQCTSFQKGDIIEGFLTDENPVKYKWTINFKKEGLWIYNHNTLIKEGEPVVIKKAEAVSTGLKEGETTTALKVRETPGVSGREIVFDCEKPDGDTVTVKSLDKGKALTIFARTKEKEIVGKWNNYWYYVQFDIGKDCSGNTMGWVFGEFVKIK